MKICQFRKNEQEDMCFESSTKLAETLPSTCDVQYASLPSPYPFVPTENNRKYEALGGRHAVLCVYLDHSVREIHL